MKRLAPACIVLALTGCPKRDAVQDAAAPSGPVATPPPVYTAPLERVPADLDRDGRPEVVNFYEKTGGEAGRLVRRETDLNRDGRVDVITHFDQTGRIAVEQMDGDFDGAIDWTDFYEGSRRVRSEVDTDYDGRPNLWIHYSGDAITRKERDSDGDGKIDHIQGFGEDTLPGDVPPPATEDVEGGPAEAPAAEEPAENGVDTVVQP